MLVAHAHAPSAPQLQTIYEARRSKARRYRVRTVHDPSAALERLEKRLAAAESKRLAALHAVKLRAAVTANRAAAVARAEAARKKQRQARLEQSLEAARVARAAFLADTAARAARTSRKASASARVAKQREQTQAASRLTTLLHRMKRAETSREQVLVARRESAAAVAAASAGAIHTCPCTGLHQMKDGPTRMSISPLNNVPKLLEDGSSDIYMATTDDNSTLRQQQQQHSGSVIGPNAGQWLRRQAAARRIQRNWRYFAFKNGTTEALVSKFAATKVPFSCKAQLTTETATVIEAETAPPGMVHQQQQQQQQQEERQQTYQEDFVTVPENTSPRSTLPPGRIFTNTANNNSRNGRTAPANTPADGLTPIESSTPADTPRTGSPPVYGPPTPPMAVLPPASSHVIAAAGEDAVAAHASANLTETSQPVSTSLSALSPSPRRQPVARLVSSLADMAASTSLHEETPVPLPASFHESTLSFDEFAEAMSAPETLKSAQAVLRRFEDMGKVKGSFARGDLCDGLLKRLFPKLPKGKKADRYPPRAFLSAYMIQSHPEVVLSQQGPKETALAEAAGTMLASFETLLSRFLKASAFSGPSFAPLPSLLRQFDKSWVAYLELFIAWKSHDAAGLESELIRAAVELETSRLLKIGSRATAAAAAAGGVASSFNNNMTAAAALRAEAAKQDLEALEEGVDHDLKLISERVERLTGQQGAARLEAALAAARASAVQQQQQQQYNSVNVTTEATAATTATPTASGVGVPSPSNSPAKKMQRRQGQYANTSSPSSSVRSSPKHASPTEEEEEDHGQENQPQSQQQQPQPGSSGNLALMWQLLYDSTFHLPTDEAESSWKDAVGETDPMLEPAPTPEDLENLLHQGGSGGSTDALAAVLHARVRRIAEKAFWDDLGERLSGGGCGERAGATGGQANNSNSSNAAVSAAVAILAEAGVALQAVLLEGSSASADVAAQLGSAEQLAELLTATPNVASSSSGPSSASLLPSINCNALFQMLEWCGGLLRRLGAPAREGAAAAAQATIRKELASETSPAAAGKVVARALRLIAVLLKLLRLDMANAHLGMLARQLGTTPERAALYARSKMQDFLGTPTLKMATTATTTAVEGGLDYPSKLQSSSSSARDMALKLPHTRGWLALASGRLPHIETMLSEAANGARVLAAESGAAAAAGSSSQELPRRLITGRAAGAAVSNPSTTTASTTGLAGQLAVPISPKTWQGLVRCGLAQLVAGEGAVTHLALPETLTPDSGRLQGAQNEFQRLVVLTASLLALQHASRLASAGAACTDGVDSPAFVSTSTPNPIIETAKRRLSAVLASPDVCLADIAAEITSLAQAPQHETSVHAVLRSMLGKSGSALRSITSALCNALTAHLVLGPNSPAVVNASHAALTRSGAGALGAEVAILAGKLAEVAAVTEAVCGPWYEILSSDLLITTGN